MVMRGPKRLLVSVVVIVVCAGCSGTADRAGGTKPVRPVVMRVLDTLGQDEIQPYLDAVRVQSNNSVRLEVTAELKSGPPASEADEIQAVRSGRVDVAVVGARAFHPLGVASFDALIAPLAVDSMAMQQRVLAGNIPAQMLGGVRRLGLVGLAVLPGPMRKPVGVSRDLLGPDSYNHARIAISASAVADRSMRALGAVPLAEPFQGSEISRFDGLEQQVTSIAGNDYDGAARSITANVDLWPRSLVVVANPSSLRKLSTGQRALLRTAAHTSLAAAVRGQLAAETDSTKVLCSRGLLAWRSATRPQLRELRSKVAPVYTWLRQDPATNRYLDAIAALRDGGDAPAPLPGERLACPGASPSSSPAAARTTAVTAFDGTYRMVTTKREAVASDPSSGDQNWGTFVFVFSRGQFVFTQEYAPACSWGYGTYIVDGQRITWRFTNGGSISSAGGHNDPGERFDFGWSRYRDTLTLTAVPGAVSPNGMLLKPWQRISAQSVPDLLSRRCPPPAAAVPH